MSDEGAMTEVPAVEIGRRLRDARRSRNLTQADVADALGYARTTVVAIEKGERRVVASELLAFAELYGRSSREFMRAQASTTSMGVQLRSAAKVAGADLTSTIAEFEQLSADYVELERIAGVPHGRVYPPPQPIDSTNPERSAEQIANYERNRLGLGEGPIQGLRQIIEEDVGARVFYIAMPSHIAAMFSYTSELGACIAVNVLHPPDRRRMSIGHEYGHLVTRPHQPDVAVLERYQRVPEYERFAEAFARCFLMPTAGLIQRFQQIKVARGGFTNADLVRLAHFYFVSVEAMALRLEELSLLRKGTWDHVRSLGFKVRHAQAALQLDDNPASNSTVPVRYQLLVVEAVERGYISEGQAARYLRVDRLEARSVIQRFSIQTPADGVPEAMDTRGANIEGE